MIKVALLNYQAILPTRGTDGAAGWDLYAAESVQIQPGATQRIACGIVMEIPPDHVGFLCSRSGMAGKGLVVANAPGIIDSDYRGEIGVLLHNRNSYVVAISQGERIAQLIVCPVHVQAMVQVPTTALSQTERGGNGFGSTGR